MKVLIVGAGVAGLGLANSLAQRDIVPTVVEKNDSIGDANYVIVLFPNGINHIRGMALYDQLEKVLSPYDRYSMFTSSGDLLQSMTFDSIESYGPSGLVERKDLLQVLFDGTKRRGIDVRFNTTVESIEESSDSVTVKLSDGSTDVYDVVVGADGSHSTVRDMMFGDVRLDFRGFIGYTWCLDPSAVPAIVESQVFWGPGKMFAIYPTTNTVGVVCGFCGPENTPVPMEERIDYVISLFSDFKGPVPDILAALKLWNKPEELCYFDQCDMKMKKWHTDRVVLIGDACHLVVSGGVIGASFALESATVLAEELSRTDPTQSQIARSLEVYQNRRFRRCHHYGEHSRWALNVTFVSNPILVWARGKLTKAMSSNSLAGGLKSMLDEYR
ncbi:FAD-dependent urate hydroxylase-like isoform X1 [Corticium candelabrum]|uniref:FAD-dependent urate hydroxylase-like isoform X1 n=2 Tax=Corticium candelabrum TaxID=121492 RepID=UPI002E255BEE|nr:FAD-dependent urate hydroxylase-like isoform X1 [Corticium candelabrum]